MHLHTRPPLLDHSPSPRRRIDHWANGVSAQACDHLVAVSQWVLDAYTLSYPKLTTPCDVVPNGISSPDAGQRRSGRRLMVGVTSRLAPMKGLEEFLDFAAALSRRVPTARFCIAGEGEPNYVQHLQAKASALGLEKQVTFLGFVPDVGGFWTKMDLAVFTAPLEPFGLRLIEPLSFGVPTVAYTTGAGSDEVIANCRGIGAVPYGLTEDLAALASTIFNSHELRNKMSKNGRDDVRVKYSMDVMHRDIARCYDRMEETLASELLSWGSQRNGIP
jgi:glycosyltransferase involved in cell wall biosynthesis